MRGSWKTAVAMVAWAVCWPELAPAQQRSGERPGQRVQRPNVPDVAGSEQAIRQAAGADSSSIETPAAWDLAQLTQPQGLSSTLKVMVLLTVLSLAPSILIMTTCFIRFVIVFGLLRQALGTQQLPPNQVITALSLFLTWMVMSPVWTRAYDEGVRPYVAPAAGEAPLDEATAWKATLAPIREFVSDQIDRGGNSELVYMFLDFQRPDPETAAGKAYRDPQSYAEVPLSVLFPAYMLSELKTAFLIGFQIYLPFLIIDIVIATVLISMGMMMLPPVLVSLPFKLLLFVMIDGWFLTVGMLLESVRPAL